MWSKGHRRLTEQEKAHLAAIKDLPCGVCAQAGPSEAHHLEQQQHWTAIPLCGTCHRHSVYGWHGQKLAWKARKLDELKVLNETIRLLCKDAES